MRDKDARALGGHVDVFRRCKTQGSKATLKDAETAKLSSDKKYGEYVHEPTHDERNLDLTGEGNYHLKKSIRAYTYICVHTYIYIYIHTHAA